MKTGLKSEWDKYPKAAHDKMKGKHDALSAAMEEAKAIQHGTEDGKPWPSLKDVNLGLAELMKDFKTKVMKNADRVYKVSAMEKSLQGVRSILRRQDVQDRFGS